ncbi:MAG: AmmeMemoRadiSam system protein B [Deltaproteobacteria bacterium]|nr:MAG: AmmeMemoRadiSam system protein B [Deltaproteobacteria bacterium]
MKEKNQRYSYLKPVFGYLIVLILFALGSTFLFTLNKGWDSRELDEAIQQSKFDKKTFSTRDMPENIRPAAAAGLFYPDDPDKLYQEIDSLLAAKQPIRLQGVHSALVPHAAYMYSGDVAAASFREVTKDFRRVFIMAANHNGETNFRGVSLPTFSHYEIPGVQVPLSGIVDELLDDPLFVQEPAAHTKYVIEVELPFLYALKGLPEEPGFTIIPMILGRMDEADITRLAGILNTYADENTLFIFSVDLSHFYTDRKARQLDSFTIQSILSHDSAALSQTTADGPQVLLTMVELAELNGWESTLLQYKNSGAVSGDRSKVVGYAAIAFHRPFSLTKDEKTELLKLARSTIEEYLQNGDFSDTDPALLEKHTILKIPRGVFVTLKKDGQLRGCIGDIISPNPLHEGVQFCAFRSAFKDTRFSPVTLDELDNVVISISILEFPSQIKVKNPLEYPRVLRPGEDGIIMVHRGKRSTYLPQVWDEIPDPVEFLSRLCLKQDSPANCWQDSQTILYRYGALEFAEENKEI